LQSPGYAERIKVPVLMFQAGEDQIVSNSRQRAFAERLPNGRLVVIEGAMHEILKETDEHREQIWKAIGEFIDLENGPQFDEDTLANTHMPKGEANTDKSANSDKPD
jgi:lysophospholipase